MGFSGDRRLRPWASASRRISVERRPGSIGDKKSVLVRGGHLAFSRLREQLLKRPGVQTPGCEHILRSERGQVAKQNGLTDRIAIVTGASGGIGRATALALAEEGAHVALAARGVDALRAVAQAIESRGREALVVPTDVCQQDQVEHLVQATLERWGRVDILVANAGVYVRAPIASMTVADVQRSLAVNFYGELYAILAVLPTMCRQRSGSLVLISSMDGRKGIPTDGPYVVAKFALHGLGDVLRQELYGTGVYSTIVCPGRVATPMIAGMKLPRISAPISPEMVARAIVRAIYTHQPEVILPFGARMLDALDYLSPRLGDWVVRLFRLQGREVSAS